MPLYLTISRGPRADLAEPVLASADRTVIEAVLAAIRRLDDPSPTADGEAEVDHEGCRFRLVAPEGPDERPT